MQFSFRRIIKKIKRKLQEPQTIKAIGREQTNPVYTARAQALHRFIDIKSKATIPVLKRYAFDSDRAIRRAAITMLVERIGTKKVGTLIDRVFPKNCPLMPEFHRLEYEKRKFLSDWPGFKNNEHAIRTNFSELKFYKNWRGCKVYLAPSDHLLLTEKEGQKTHTLLGQKIEGNIIINSDPLFLPEEFREATMEHEFGEAWNHSIGHILQIEYLRKKGLLKRYLRFYAGKGYDFEKDKEYVPLFKKL